MTLTAERPTYRPSKGEVAYEAINSRRDEMGEQFELTELDREFALYMHRLGASGLYLADAAANHARTFKWRGAYSAMSALHEQGVESVTVPSAGNHLRGAVMAGKVLGMAVHGVVPMSAPTSKKEGAKQLWGDEPGFNLHVVGNSFDESLAWAQANAETLGEVVHPFDDPLVSAGQGTLADDIYDSALQSGLDLQHVVLPVGGGGLFRGVAERFMELGTNITVHGVEAQGSNSLSRSAEAGMVVDATRPNARYGGSAVKTTATRTLDAYQNFPNTQLWKVGDDEVTTVVEDYLEEIHYRELDRYPAFVPFEPTTLVAIAGLSKIARAYPGEAIAVIGTGRNDAPQAIWK